MVDFKNTVKAGKIIMVDAESTGKEGKFTFQGLPKPEDIPTRQRPSWPKPPALPAAKSQTGDSRDKQLCTLDLGALVDRSRYRGDFEERLKKVLKEIRTRGDIILFIDEIHTLVGAAAAVEGAIDAASILKPTLARGELQIRTLSRQARLGALRDSSTRPLL